MRKNFCIFFLLSIFLIINSFNSQVVASEQSNVQLHLLKSYDDYLNEYSKTELGTNEIILKSKDAKNHCEESKRLHNFNEVKQSLQWQNKEQANQGYLSWDIEVPETGLYILGMKYYPLESKYSKIELKLYIDSEIPFDGANVLMFTKPWHKIEQIKQDSRNNDIMPKQKQCGLWMNEPFKDTEGRYNEPYKFYLTKGHHNITLEGIYTDFILDYLKFYPQKQLISYNEVLQLYKDKQYKVTKEQIKIIQAEDMKMKSDSTIVPNYDRSDAQTQPTYPDILKLNTVGGDRWKQSAQWIEWEFDVEESGLYQIGLRARQNLRSGLVSNRRFYLDGKVPFKECDIITFPFDTKWYLKVIGDKDPYLFYLEKGKHTVRLETIPGELAYTKRVLEDSLYRLNNLYRKIMMITGPNPDTYRDYKLDKEIPNLMNEFIDLNKILTKEKDRVEKITGKRGSETVSIQSLITQTSSFIREPDTIALRLEKFKQNISSLASWMLGLSEQPLEIDYFVIKSPDGDFPNVCSNFFQRMGFEISKIISSFKKDYSVVGDTYKNKEALTVWVGKGRDQVQVVKELVDEYFVPETGIKVNVNLVPTGLKEAVLAGKGPDVSLFVVGEDPINLAIRGAVVELSEYEDFDEVSKRFMEESLVPYSLYGKCYALPLTQTFPMLFIRTDIFQELGLSIPKTWEEFYRLIPDIQRKYLDIGIPTTVNTFGTLLYQREQRFYNDNLSRTNLETKEALDAFTQWTDFYNRYSLPLAFEAYNRFRTGEMPIVMQDYIFYNQLKVKAPEIKNLWTMIPVCGFSNENKEINNSVCAGVTEGCLILKDAKNKNDAWKFLKWFTSADIQSKFGLRIEALLGSIDRYATANVEAFKQLPWPYEEQEKILEQWKKLKVMPIIPGSYYINRHINNAFRSVTYHYNNPRHSLHTYNLEINKEIKRKRIEFGFE